MPISSRIIFSSLVAFVFGAVAANAWAGRPLAVDDAATNDAGNGHVELWYAQAGSAARAVSIAPAYAPIANLELSAQLTRDTEARLTAYAAQAKWVFIPTRENGCNAGVVVGAGRVQGNSDTTPYGNLLVTCNGGFGAIHMNGGAYKPRGDSAVTTWGVAYEREVGPVMAHVEVFGERGSRAAVQIGLRGNIAPKLQLDGSIGSRDGETLLTVGLKLAF